VFYNPSAYLSKKDPSSIYLFANISFSSIMSYAIISIEINNFNGIGEYIIPSGKGVLTTFYGDVGNVFPSDSSLTNTISIEQFDDVNNICSGRFNFSIGNHAIELRDGTFTIPIYR
jgi:hypothetical protein